MLKEQDLLGAEHELKTVLMFVTKISLNADFHYLLIDSSKVIAVFIIV